MIRSSVILAVFGFNYLLTYFSSSKRGLKNSAWTGTRTLTSAMQVQCSTSWVFRSTGSWGLFLESPESFRAYFGWHNYLRIFKTKTSRGKKLCSYFYFYSLYNIWKDQLYIISRSSFYEWLYGPEKLSGLSRNGPLGPVSRKSRELFGRITGDNSLCIFKTKASRGTKLCSYFYFYSLYNIWKDQLYRISRS